MLNLDTILFYLEMSLYFAVIYFISITVHEYAHGFVAYKLGDPTAKDAGRLSFNPIRHLDPIGLVMMIFFRFGWAKPVPVNPQFFKNSKRGMMLTSVAGPVSNLLLAFFSSFISEFARISMYMSSNNHHQGFTAVLSFLYVFFMYMAVLNIGLAIFNLIPVYPLDGSRLLGYFMPNSFNRFMMDYGTYIYIAFFVVLIVTDFISDGIVFIEDTVFDWFTFVWYKPAELLASLLFG